MSDPAVPSDGDAQVHALVPGPAIGDLLDPYLGVDRVRADGRCWVLANMVAGLDGTAAVGGWVGALSHGADAELFRLLRTVADVVLVGAETVRRRVSAVSDPEGRSGVCGDRPEVRVPIGDRGRSVVVLPARLPGCLGRWRQSSAGRRLAPSRSGRVECRCDDGSVATA